MNWLDFTLIGVITLGTLFGIISGPLWQIYRISSVAFSIAASLLLHRLLTSIIKEIFSPKVSSVLGYATKGNCFWCDLNRNICSRKSIQEISYKKKIWNEWKAHWRGYLLYKNDNNVLCDYSRRFILGE